MIATNTEPISSTEGITKSKKTGWVVRFGQCLLILTASIIVRIFYRVRCKGWQNLPKEGGAVLICNHVSYVDAVLLGLSSPRKIRFMSHDKFQSVPILGALLRLAEVIPVSPEHSRDAVRKAVECAKQGDIVGIFPEGHLSRDGHLASFQRGYELIARRSNVPVIPVCLDGLWGSIFSFKGGRYFWKLPRKIPYRVSISVGNPSPANEMTPENARQTIIDMGADTFASRPSLQTHLSRRVLEALVKSPSRIAVVDYSAGRKAVNAATLAALSITLAAKIRMEISEKRVGIIMPPSLGGTIANLAVSLAGKTPVNLNFTLGRTAMESCLRRADIKTTITAGAVKKKIDEKFTDFPWSEELMDLSEAIANFSKPKLLLWILGCKFLPNSIVLNLAKAPKGGGDDEAALLFTSGSSGEPKGVVLTHKNILGNTTQIIESGVFPDDASLLANLPIFHSFGFTVTVWAPLIEDVKVVYTPSPLDFKTAVKAIKAEQTEIMLGTPTFFRPYLSRVKPEDMASVKVVVAGAEKTPDGFHEAWEARFPGSHFLEGYGLTETSPVAAVNIPDEYLPPGLSSAEGKRRGSVGRLFSGMAAKVISTETGESLPVGETGILCLKGVNIFAGYLDDKERTDEVLDDGWLTTGDLARLDDEGFLYIEGRLSRFSKIGGEMVPHGVVETAIAKAFDVDSADEPMVAIGSKHDPAKGEALVLLSVPEIKLSELRDKLKEAGLPNLWVPKTIVKVDKIPTLASGKLELAKIKELSEHS